MLTIKNQNQANQIINSQQCCKTIKQSIIIEISSVTKINFENLANFQLIQVQNTDLAQLQTNDTNMLHQPIITNLIVNNCTSLIGSVIFLQCKILNLELTNCVRDSDINFLITQQQLQELSIIKMQGLLDLSKIMELNNLKKLQFQELDFNKFQYDIFANSQFLKKLDELIITKCSKLSQAFELFSYFQANQIHLISENQQKLEFQAKQRMCQYLKVNTYQFQQLQISFPNLVELVLANVDCVDFVQISELNIGYLSIISCEQIKNLFCLCDCSNLYGLSFQQQTSSSINFQELDLDCIDIHKLTINKCAPRFCEMIQLITTQINVKQMNLINMIIDNVDFLKKNKQLDTLLFENCSILVQLDNLIADGCYKNIDFINIDFEQTKIQNNNKKPKIDKKITFTNCLNLRILEQMNAMTEIEISTIQKKIFELQQFKQVFLNFNNYQIITIIIQNCQITDLNFLKDVRCPKSIIIDHCEKLQNLEGLSYCGELYEFYVTNSYIGNVKLFYKQKNNHLGKNLYIKGNQISNQYYTLNNLDFIKKFKGVEEIQLQCLGIQTLNFLRNYDQLIKLQISNCINLADTADLANCQSIQQLMIFNTGQYPLQLNHMQNNVKHITIGHVQKINNINQLWSSHDVDQVYIHDVSLQNIDFQSQNKQQKYKVRKFILSRVQQIQLVHQVLEFSIIGQLKIRYNLDQQDTDFLQNVNIMDMSLIDFKMLQEYKGVLENQYIQKIQLERLDMNNLDFDQLTFNKNITLNNCYNFKNTQNKKVKVISTYYDKFVDEEYVKRNTYKVESIEDIENYKNELKKMLYIVNVDVINLSQFWMELNQLRKLTIKDCNKLKNLNQLSKCNYLYDIDITNCGLGDIQLYSIQIENNEQFILEVTGQDDENNQNCQTDNLDFLRTYTNINKITIKQSNIDNLWFICDMINLMYIHITECDNLNNIFMIKKHQNTKTIEIACTKILFKYQQLNNDQTKQQLEITSLSTIDNLETKLIDLVKEFGNLYSYIFKVKTTTQNFDDIVCIIGLQKYNSFKNNQQNTPLQTTIQLLQIENLEEYVLIKLSVKQGDQHKKLLFIFEVQQSLNQAQQQFSDLLEQLEDKEELDVLYTTYDPDSSEQNSNQNCSEFDWPNCI